MAFDQDHRNNGALAGLDEHEGFKDFIHGAKATGETHNRFGMVDEHQLPRKEVPEVDQFGITLDDFIGRRLERKTNGQPKGTFPTWALMTGLHDAVAGTGDGHPALFGHAAAEFHRGEVIGVVLGCAG